MRVFAVQVELLITEYDQHTMFVEDAMCVIRGNIEQDSSIHPHLRVQLQVFSQSLLREAVTKELSQEYNSLSME
jgi:hypothetical protein